MSINELKRELKKMNIPQMLYSIDDEGNQHNRIVLKAIGMGRYIVYFDTDDGRRLYEFIFEDEESACEYVLSAFNKNYFK